jgi:flagellar biosynthesis component FlhA
MGWSDLELRDVKKENSEITSNLSVIYEDPEVVVYTAPNEDELKSILLSLLHKNEKMNIRELHSILSGLASEDKIRHALSELVEEGKVLVDSQGYYYITSSDEIDEYFVEEE